MRWCSVHALHSPLMESFRDPAPGGEPGDRLPQEPTASTVSCLFLPAQPFSGPGLVGPHQFAQLSYAFLRLPCFRMCISSVPTAQGLHLSLDGAVKCACAGSAWVGPAGAAWWWVVSVAQSLVRSRCHVQSGGPVCVHTEVWAPSETRW